VQYDGRVKPIREMTAGELLELVRGGGLDEAGVLAVLRHPYCTVEIVREVLGLGRVLGSHAVRERIAAFPGLEVGRALNLLPTLPWLSLVHVAQEPRTPPLIKRRAEQILVQRIRSMTLGEMVAFARCAHRPLIRVLGRMAPDPVLEALLDNPRVIEEDILLVLSAGAPSPRFLRSVSRHRRWGSYYRLRHAVAIHPAAPLPLASSLLVQLTTRDLRRIAANPAAAAAVRERAQALVTRREAPAEPGDGRIQR